MPRILKKCDDASNFNQSSKYFANINHMMLHEKGTTVFYVGINGEKMPVSFKMQKSVKYTLTVCYVIVLTFY